LKGSFGPGRKRDSTKAPNFRMRGGQIRRIVARGTDARRLMVLLGERGREKTIAAKGGR